LLGLGLDELSMNPMSIPRVKRIIRMTSHKKAKKFLGKVMALKTTEEINAYVKQEMFQLFSDSFGINGRCFIEKERIQGACGNTGGSRFKCKIK